MLDDERALVRPFVYLTAITQLFVKKLKLMKKCLLVGLILCLTTITASAFAKTLAGYDFDDYQLRVYQGKKAPLKLGDWRSFRTRLRWAHQEGSIAFGGHYMVAMWGCGTGCITGVMIDKRSGHVYGLPIGEQSPYDLFCGLEDYEGLVFYPNSRLFISRNCHQEEVGDNQLRQDFVYFVHVWNETTKNFELIDTVKNSRFLTTTEE